jgi:hypothetical protein
MVKVGDIITSHTGKQVKVLWISKDRTDMRIQYLPSKIEKVVCKNCKKHVHLFD